MSQINPSRLPAQYAGKTPDQLLAELPFVWQPGLRMAMGDQAWSQTSDLDQRSVVFDAIRNNDRYLLPPDIAHHVTHIITTSSAVTRAVIDMTVDDHAKAFEAEVLGINPATIPNSQRGYVSASGFTQPGHYPLATFAEALHADPDRVHEYVVEYWNKAPVAARIGDYMVGVTAVGPWLDQSQIGLFDPIKFSQVGKGIFDATLRVVDTLQRSTSE